MKRTLPSGRLPITAKPPLPVRLVTILVLLNGVVILLDNLWRQLHIRVGGRANGIIVSIPVILGLTLIYLSTMLRRRKRAAWLVVIPFYALIFGLHLGQLFVYIGERHFRPLFFLQDIVAPAAAVAGLIYYRDLFRARSATRSVFVVLKRVILIVAVTIAYGAFGYTLFDQRDFHREISLPQAVQFTVDQAGFTADTPIPHTRRARVFTDSLEVISLTVLMYIIAALFSPLRARLEDQAENRRQASELLAQHSHDSEDFFKLWPHDKLYVFNESRTAGLAYQVNRGVAMVMGAPFGSKQGYRYVLDAFDEMCQVNDWMPAFIHMLETDRKLFEEYGYAYQKIGEEAVINLDTFNTVTARNKHFRNVKNRFEKQGYACEFLSPPHSDAVVKRLGQITQDWLAQPGRTERGFMMGYFDDAYLQQCDIVVVRDEAATIQAFLNIVPVYDGVKEANYDFLRHTSDSPPNINDFLLLNVLQHVPDRGYTHFNLGLCPLAGLDDNDESQARQRTIIDRTLNVFYNAGDRLYSFSGLYRFKAKFDPVWRDRYAVYPSGVANFARAFAALNRIGQRK